MCLVAFKIASQKCKSWQENCPDQMAYKMKHFVLKLYVLCLFWSAMQMNEMEYLQRGDFNFVGTVPVPVKWHVH